MPVVPTSSPAHSVQWAGLGIIQNLVRKKEGEVESERETKESEEAEGVFDATLGSEETGRAEQADMHAGETREAEDRQAHLFASALGAGGGTHSSGGSRHQLGCGVPAQ